MLNFFNIKYGVVLLAVAISVARSDETGCICKDKLNSDGGGNCQTDSKWCYVAQPSSCIDLNDGQKLEGEMFSYEACATKGFPEVTSFAGYCLDASGGHDTGFDRFGTGIETPVQCSEKCYAKPGCVAFSYSPEDRRECQMFFGGPYTQGDGASGSTCYLMPAVKCSADDDCVDGQVCSSSGVCGGWYLGLEDENCDHACNLHGGLKCSEGEFHRYNSDIDSSDEVLSLIKSLGGTTSAAKCSGDLGTNKAVPSVDPKKCLYSKPSRSVSTFDCEKTPTSNKKRQRLCRCHASVACASKSDCPDNFPFCTNGFCSETGLVKGERDQFRCPTGSWTIEARGREIIAHQACIMNCPAMKEKVKYGYNDCHCLCSYANTCEEITRQGDGCSSEHNCKWTTDVNGESGQCVTNGEMIPGWKVIWGEPNLKGTEYCEQNVGWNKEKQTANECILYCETNGATVASYDTYHKNCACCNDPPVFSRFHFGSITTYQFEQSSTA